MNKRFVNGQQVDENGTPIAPKKTAAEQLPKDMNNPDSEGASEEQISEMFGAEKPNPSLDDEAGKGDITESLKLLDSPELKKSIEEATQDLMDKGSAVVIIPKGPRGDQDVEYRSVAPAGQSSSVSADENTSKDEESSNEK